MRFLSRQAYWKAFKLSPTGQSDAVRLRNVRGTAKGITRHRRIGAGRHSLCHPPNGLTFARAFVAPEPHSYPSDGRETGLGCNLQYLTCTGVVWWFYESVALKCSILVQLCHSGAVESVTNWSALLLSGVVKQPRVGGSLAPLPWHPSAALTHRLAAPQARASLVSDSQVSVCCGGVVARFSLGEDPRRQSESPGGACYFVAIPPSRP
jgi:hypothetical protein